mgnify:FL=1
MAEHLEKVQWFKRPDCNMYRSDTLFDNDLPTNDDETNIDELRGIVKTLKNNEAARSDDIPAEIWKAIAADDDALQHLVSL